MLFARLDVDVYTHPRFMEAGFEASGYWMHVLAYLRHRESSDGFLADHFITIPLATNKLVARRLCNKLVEVGLFGRVEGGYLLLRYADKNDTKEAIEENRKALRERKTRWKRAARDSPPSDPALARQPLPLSERALSGPYWLAAFTDGITLHTGRPCTVGRMYLATLERIVAHHAPDRDAARASDWIREQSRSFAEKWDGQHPPKGLTPDGLERWLNEGRPSPPQFGRSKIVQPPASEWKPDDFSDYGARLLGDDDEDPPTGPRH